MGRMSCAGEDLSLLRRGVALPPQDACCSRTDGSLETKSLQECPQAVGRHPEREGDS